MSHPKLIIFSLRWTKYIIYSLIQVSILCHPIHVLLFVLVRLLVLIISIVKGTTSRQSHFLECRSNFLLHNSHNFCRFLPQFIFKILVHRSSRLLSPIQILQSCHFQFPILSEVILVFLSLLNYGHQCLLHFLCKSIYRIPSFFIIFEDPLSLMGLQNHHLSALFQTNQLHHRVRIYVLQFIHSL